MLKRAVILAAGGGTRLRPLTAEMPKCLTEVCNKPILFNTLELLKKNGINEVVIVVGHFKDKIMDCVNKHFKDMKIIYVHNPVYDKTNNIYSLWLAREYMKEDFILLEGDIFFEDMLIKKLINEKKEILALLAKHHSWMDGTVATLSNGYITSLFLKKEQTEGFNFSNTYKTVNIYKFSKKFMEELFLPCLDQFIKDNNVNTYYEFVLKKVLTDNKSLKVCGLIIDGIKWYEIDTLGDLEKAEKIFSCKI